MLARLRATGTAALAVALVALLSLSATASATAASGRIQGQVQGNPFPGAFRVSLYQAVPGAAKPRRLGTTLTRRGGTFSLAYKGATRRGVHYLVAARPGGGAEAGFPVPVSSYRLATALGDRRIPRRSTIDDRTTVAAAFAMAQFFHGDLVAGENPGLRNAAAMTRNLVGPRGGVSPVLRRFPNGRSTSTLPAFNSLANLVASCRHPGGRCARLLKLGAKPGGSASPNTLVAMTMIARYPWHDVRGLFGLSRLARPVYSPSLKSGERPDAWTLALRFEGVRKTMDGPGNLAIDRQGGLWVTNNYDYDRRPTESVCASAELLRFTPTGRGYPGSPYEGGGLSGAGFGITLDPEERVWVANFGFVGRGCGEPANGSSVSLFGPDGKAISPASRLVEEGGAEVLKGGYEQSGIDQPQSTVSDREGNIWIANCGNSSVTRYSDGNPEDAINVDRSVTGLAAPFGIAVNAEGTAYVTGNGSSSVAILGPDGKPAADSPVTGHGLHRPMGIATDSRGNMWVANSGKVVVGFCPEALHFEGGAEQGSVVLIKRDGEVRRFKGAGMETPWGIAVDGNDTVWVANFSDQRLSQVCGMRPRLCPPGKQRTGTSISPRRTGYGFDGLVRNTGVQIDPSGNVWLANNWRQKAIQTNPGGFQIVAYLGIAAPIRTPLIGPPEQP